MAIISQGKFGGSFKISSWGMVPLTNISSSLIELIAEGLNIGYYNESS